MDDRPLGSPTPVEEVSEISQLRHQLNEKNLLIIESRVAKDRAIQDLHSTMQKNLVELATTKSELRRLKRARPLHRNDGHSFASTGGRSFRATPASTQGRNPNYTDSAGENDASHYSTSSSTTSLSSSSSSTYQPTRHGTNAARTHWPHEKELKTLTKKHAKQQSQYRALEKTLSEYNVRQMEHQNQCETWQARVRDAEEARTAMKTTVLRLQRQSAVLGNELSSRVSLVESKSVEYRRRLQEAEQREHVQEDEIHQLQQELTLVSTREDILKRRVKDALTANDKGRLAVVENDRLMKKINRLNIALEHNETVMAQQAKRAQTAIEYQNALVAVKGRLAQKEEQLLELREHLKRSRGQTREETVKGSQSKEEIAIVEAKLRTAIRVNEDLKSKLETSKIDNETLRHHHAGQMEHVKQLQADLASLSSLGMEESSLFASGVRGGGRVSEHRTAATSTEKVNISLQRKLEATEQELNKMKEAIDNAVGSGGGQGSGEGGGSERGWGSGGGQGSGKGGPDNDALVRSLCVDVDVMVGEVLTMVSLLMKILNGEKDLIGPDDLLVDSDVLTAREKKERTKNTLPLKIPQMCKTVGHARNQVKMVRQTIADRLVEELSAADNCGLQ